MNREELIRVLEKGFTSEWIKQSGTPDYKIINLVQESFLPDQMVESLNKDLQKAKNRILKKRYQRFLLTSLSNQFADLLFYTSNEGKNVNPSTIREAQEILKHKGNCPIMPCIKPK
jgi:hypothetical protein